MATIVQQDLGMTPAPVELSQQAEEEEPIDEEDGEALFQDGIDYDEEQEEDGPIEYEVDEDGGVDDDGEYAGDGGDDDDGDMMDGDDPDADLDGMDPSEMDDDQQVRWLERQHAREMMVREAARASQEMIDRARAATTIVHQDEPEEEEESVNHTNASDDFFASPGTHRHVTPPTRAQRVPVSGAPSAPRVVSSVSMVRGSPPGRSMPTGGTVRRTLDLDSSNDSMQIDTPPRATQQASAAPTPTHTAPAAAPSDDETGAMLAEMGLSPEEVEALLEEQRMIFNQAARR